jgi:N6-adenosine-specific RNA methylase IME4
MYDVFMVDPPWPKKKGGYRSVRPKQGRNLDYRTMGISNIFKLLDTDVFPLANEQHVVFLWTVDQFLHDAERMMEERGYKRHARLVWDKGNGVAPCFTVRYAHEYLLWYYKPKLLKVDKASRGKFLTVFREPGRQHSRKPDVAYNMVAAWYPEASRIDVFSREIRWGWAQFGDETERFKSKILVSTESPTIVAPMTEEDYKEVEKLRNTQKGKVSE